MNNNVTYMRPPDIMPEPEVCDLFSYDARIVPHTIRSLYDLTGKPFWTNRDEWIQASNRLALNIERLLMPCGEDIIREIRALRDGNATLLADQDVTKDPFTLQLTSLRDISLALNGPNGTANAILLRIEQLQTAANAGDEESLAELLRIGAIVAGGI